MEGDSVKYNIHSSVGRLHLLMCSWSLVVGEGGGFALLNIPSQDPGCRCLQSSAAAETLIITLASIQEAGAGQAEIEEDLFLFFPPRPQEAVSSGG